MKAMARKSNRYFVGDFETTVYDKQEYTCVWASAIVELHSEDVTILHSIGETFEWLKDCNCNLVIYYHNLKFDGSFWLDYLINKTDLTQAIEQTDENDKDTIRFKKKELPNNTYTYMISSMGQWYGIKIRVNNHTIEIRDSLKLLPFSVEKIGKSFGTKHKKLSMEYEGLRYEGCEITDEEKKYIANDVLVVKEALEIMFAEGHTKLTIGSCCLSEYKKIIGFNNFKKLFPNMFDIEINEERFGVKNAGEFIRKSYKGGWCYLVKGKEQKMFHNGTTADVNSLYPSVMSSESGNEYPVGIPHFWHGNYIPVDAVKPHTYFFIKIRTRFYLKKGMLPFIQIKNSFYYKSTQMLETSDIYDRKSGKYYKYYKDFDGNIIPSSVELTLTQTDYKLFLEHYDVEDFEILSGCWFNACGGIFDNYMEKYKKIKIESKGAIRELAKLFLNNLYGKMASTPNSSFKVAYAKSDTTVGFYDVIAYDKIPGFIPIGSAITSYARNFTIRAAQQNYYGVDKPGFIYADTDSIHCDLPPEQIKGITVHPTNFCCWKLESCWDNGWFVRQKTYIEHVTHEDLQPVTPHYSIKCAGMPQKCKDLFERSMIEEPLTDDEKEKYTTREKDFLKKKRTVEDFNIGLVVPGKLMPKRMRGGVVLTDTDYEMHE